MHSGITSASEIGNLMVKGQSQRSMSMVVVARATVGGGPSVGRRLAGGELNSTWRRLWKSSQHRPAVGGRV